MPFSLTFRSLKTYAPTDILRPVSTDASGAHGSKGSWGASISADGRYVLFESGSADLVPGDTNGWYDLFRKDLWTGAIVRVSTTASGAEGNGASGRGAISADGRHVVFESLAKNLVGGAGVRNDIFHKDLATGEISLVSSNRLGGAGNKYSSSPSISADGRFVVFISNADDLVEGDTNLNQDVFRKDLVTGKTVRVSTAADGSQLEGGGAPSISADGRYVVFSSHSRAVPGDTNDLRDVFRKDMATGEVVQVSTASDGAPATSASSARQGGSISGDGRYVVFSSGAGNLVAGDTNGKADIFRKDLLTGVTERVSVAADGTQADGTSYEATISADGRFVVFESLASNLTKDDREGTLDVFRKDMVTGEILRLSDLAQGDPDEIYSTTPVSSADGRFVAFISTAPLNAGDGNGEADVYVVDAALLPHRGAVETGRYARLDFDVGTASSVTVSWADGSSETATPVGGAVSFAHLFGSAQGEAAVLTLAEGGQSWAVPYTVSVASGSAQQDMSRADTLSGGAGADRLTGTAGANVLRGLGGDDVLDGSGGADRLEGGAGHDRYLVGDSRALVVERAGEGLDRVDAAVNVSLAPDAAVEILAAVGGASHLVGSQSDNRILGNAGRDVLKGEGGRDVLHGKHGRDILFGGEGRDAFVFDTRIGKKSAKAHRDKVKDFHAKDDSIWLENKVFKKLGRKGSEDKPAKLKKAFFAFDKAKDGNDHIVYIKKKGVLAYDPDGAGRAKALEIASFGKNEKVTSWDIFVI